MTTLDTLNKYEPRSSLHEVPIVWDWARGWTVGSKDKEYIDFTSGIFVANIGHSHPDVLQAIHDQLSEPLLHSYAFPNWPRANLVEKLIQMTGFEKVFLCTTGAEAVEAAIRCMRAYGKKTFATPVYGIRNAFHGHTEGAKRILTCLHDGLTVSNGLEPPPMSGIMIETYLGYNAKFHNVAWVKSLVEEAQEHDIPVCFDEVQSGLGRTGKLFGYEHYDVKPDLIVVGKALGGGMPISAVLGRAALLDAPDDLSSTHTGNPVCCAAALASLGVLEKENLVEKARDIGEVIEGRLGDLKINGMGAVWAVDLQDIDSANRIVGRCAEKGLLLVKTYKGTVKIGPPLTIPQDALAKGLTILRDVILGT